ncbi:hypothetical protein PDE_04977 [Penicillium oxalicum 114-2]|uniref:Uncharacterized protein n=1 Tax=Penicillium oxalicum (strain 114-2 / CGMCC 5302) TaxID=933388 RepID=S8B5X7_PENO1|nr:hypothetical protein PDE_04977 [Penicillium oxalicum 114-2]
MTRVVWRPWLSEASGPRTTAKCTIVHYDPFANRLEWEIPGDVGRGQLSQGP